jgi:hypothetical protein
MRRLSLCVRTDGASLELAVPVAAGLARQSRRIAHGARRRDQIGIPAAARRRADAAAG